ncbi:MAG: hypothetical protein GC178_03415 [Flavobacteriales bacterium]|nr:hypothetical protein [Flavobacteriales bacterium]
MEVLNRLRNYGTKDFYGLIGFLFFGYFLLLSIVFYKECIVHQDYAWELTWILNGNGLTPVYFRWGAIPWRIFFIIGPSLDLSLKTILILSSVWFVFSKFLTWLVCHFYFRNPIAGLLVIISILFSHSEGFFAQNLQVYNASVYFCLLFAVVTDGFRIKNGWLKIGVISLLLILIKGTHIAVLIGSAPLMLIYLLDEFSLKKLVPLFCVTVFVVISQFWFPAPYEGNHMSSMLMAFRNARISDMGGILMYLGTQTVGLVYLIPLMMLIDTVRLCIASQRLLFLVIYLIIATTFGLLIMYKLITYDADYPLSNEVEFYIEGAFYSLILMFASVFLYLNQTSVDLLKLPQIQAAVVFSVLFYSSNITKAGIEHYEYNIYETELMEELSGKFDESIFIIDEKYIPARFSKIDMNIEFETLVKSNVELGHSVVLIVTAHPDTFQLSEVGPEFIISLSCLEKENQINPKMNTDKYLYKSFAPNTHFESLNTDYFHFENFRHRTVPQEFLARFNANYGFAISEY